MNKARENQRPKYVAAVVTESRHRQFGTESWVEEVRYAEVQRCALQSDDAMKVKLQLILKRAVHCFCARKRSDLFWNLQQAGLGRYLG